MKYLIFFVILISSLTCYAQVNFKPGFVILRSKDTLGISKDTLKGLIDYRGDLLMGTICHYRSVTEKEIVEYKPGDIDGYGFESGRIYASKIINNIPVFLECLIDGKLRIYYLRDENRDRYFMEKDDLQLVEIPYEEGTKEYNGMQHFYSTSIHKALLSLYTKDAPQLKSKIDSLRKPNQKNLISIAQQYHNAVCKTEECIIYKKRFSINAMVEPVIGATRYWVLDGFNPEFGAHLYLWLPEDNEKLFLKTGVIYMEISDRDVNRKVFKFPIQIQYIYPGNKFRPMAAFGLEILSAKFERFDFAGHWLNACLGFNYKIGEKTALSFTYRIETTPILGGNFEFLSNSVFAGLMFKL